MHISKSGSQSVSSPLYTLPVLLLLCVVFISFLGLGLIMPLRSLYGREVGANSVDISLMASSFLLAGFLATPLIGWLTDRWSYRAVLTGGLVLHMLLTLAYIPIQDPLLLIALRALEGIAAAAVLPPVRALMNAIAPSDRQGEALGSVGAAQTGGILIGPVVGTFLAGQCGYIWAFMLAGIPLGIAGLLTWLSLPALRSQSPEVNRAEQTKWQIRRELYTPQLLLAYTLQFFLLIANGVGAAIWTLYMLDRHSSLFLIGLSFSTFALPIILLSPLAGRLSDHWGRYKPLLIGLLASGLVFWLYSLPLTPMMIVLISCIEGVAIAIVRAPVDGFLADIMPVYQKGKIQANYNAAGTLGSLLGSIGAGMLYLITPGAPFMAESIIYLALLLCLLLPGLAHLFIVPEPRSTVITGKLDEEVREVEVIAGIE